MAQAVRDVEQTLNQLRTLSLVSSQA
jgi:hypothetical protein